MRAFWTLHEKKSVRGLIGAGDRNNTASWDSNSVR